MTDELRIQAQTAAARLRPYGKSILDAVDLAVAHWQAASASEKVGAAIDAMIQSKEADGRSGRYIADLRGRLQPFRKEFEDLKISMLSSKVIREWLSRLPVGPVSRNNTQRILSVLFTFAMEHEWCEVNPMDRISTAVEPAGQIGILTPQQAAKLLVGAPARFIPHLAIGLFCGLRRSELERVGPHSVRAEHIEVTVTKTKGAARRFVRIRPNLREWLNKHTPGEYSEKPFRKDLDDTIDAAGIDPWPNNALRHSFCTYALAHERNLQDLTLEMGHTNPHTLFAHYRELVTPDQAALYWSITPQSVEEIASCCLTS